MLAQSLHSILGVAHDAEIEVNAVSISTIGLANTLVMLGTPHPRCKKQAEIVLHEYLLALYRLTKQLCDKLGIEFLDLTIIINNPRRVQQRKQLRDTLRHLKHNTYDPVLDYVFSTLSFLLTEETNSTKAIYAGKRLLAAWKLADSDYDLYGELTAALTNLLGE